MNGLEDMVNTLAMSILAGGFVVATLVAAFALAIASGRNKRIKNETEDRLK